YRLVRGDCRSQGPGLDDRHRCVAVREGAGPDFRSAGRNVWQGGRMIPLHNFLFYCLLYAVAIATPGPGIFSIVARALSQGFRKTVPACLGIMVGDLILMTLSAFGLALVA